MVSSVDLQCQRGWELHWMMSTKACKKLNLAFPCLFIYFLNFFSFFASEGTKDSWSCFVQFGCLKGIGKNIILIFWWVSWLVHVPDVILQNSTGSINFCMTSLSIFEITSKLFAKLSETFSIIFPYEVQLNLGCSTYLTHVIQSLGEPSLRFLLEFLICM